MFKVSAEAKNILERLDGRATAEQIASEFGEATEPAEIERLLGEHFGSLGVFESAGTVEGPPAETPARTPESRFPFLVLGELMPARTVRAVSARLKMLYRRPAAIAVIALIAILHVVGYSVYGDRGFYSRAHLLLMLPLALAGLVFHELGHAAALANFGGKCGGIGCGLFALMPNFYADVSDVWLLKPKQRVVVDLGGVYFQSIAASLFLAMGILTLRPEFFAAFRFLDLIAVVILSPIFRFDGYWVLCDYLGIPRLHSYAWAYLSSMARRVPAPSLPRLDGSRRVALGVYVVLVWAFLVVLVYMQYRSIYLPLRHLPRTFSMLAGNVTRAWAKGRYLRSVELGATFFVISMVPFSGLLGLFQYGRRGIAKLEEISNRRRAPAPAAAPSSCPGLAAPNRGGNL
jgi:putative peptide zinc metalloprotease protein